jgi:hypothetical protein
MNSNIEKVEKLMRKFQKIAHHAQFGRKWNYNQNNRLEMSYLKHFLTKSKFTDMELTFQRSKTMRINFRTMKLPNTTQIFECMHLCGTLEL